MNRSFWIRVLAVLLVICMLPVGTIATGKNAPMSSHRADRITDLAPGRVSRLEPPKATEPVATESAEPDAGKEGAAHTLTAIENASTVDNGSLLRASTYQAKAADEGAEQAAGVTLKYFPVTMYNYDRETFMNATAAKEDGDNIHEGFYFVNSSMKPTIETITDLSAFVAGQYYIQNVRARENGVDSWLQAFPTENKIYAVEKAQATVWNLVIEDGKYYLTCEIGGETNYLKVGTNGDNDGYTTQKTSIDILQYSSSTNEVQLCQNNYYLCQWGYTTATDYGGYDQKDDAGNAMQFFPVNSDTALTVSSESKVVSGYERWNRWDKGDSSENGDLLYTGLVEPELVNGEIRFTVPEGGVFNDDDTVKDIYNYVGLPLVMDSETGFYTFNSNIMSAVFPDKNNDGTLDLASGTKINNEVTTYDLVYSSTPQRLDIALGDGSTYGWFPFGNGDDKYHFGMRMNIPFSMTPNGRVQATNDASRAIEYYFSGDDDVWIFIDGKLVVDLGGIHNRLNAKIDFAANTITYYEDNKQDENGTTGSYNDSDFATVQKLFNDREGTGLLNVTREVFATEQTHELQMFYLERGEGGSNAQIMFNFPMHDAVLITKDATKSWSQAAADAEMNGGSNVEDPGVEDLTSSEQAAVDNMLFGFTLYKKTADQTKYTTVANTNYYLLDSAGEVQGIYPTDANGHFLLRNGYTAKFITEIPEEGITYYVIEDEIPDGFVTPDYNFRGRAALGYSYTGLTGTEENSETGEIKSGTVTDASDIIEQIIPESATEYKSFEVTVKGSMEATDTIEFICSNYLDAELPNPAVIANEDIIVLDFGLPVTIDPLANDIYRGENMEILYVGDASVELTEPTGDNGVSWTESAAFHSGKVALVDKKFSIDAETGVVTRDTITYTPTSQLNQVEVITYIVRSAGSEATNTGGVSPKYAYSIGKIYIVPATSVYYEENFDGLVTFQNGKGSWGALAEVQFPNQEPGVIGFAGDSSYGCDTVYMQDSKDSNRTSVVGDTTDGPIRFFYTFTGTGTTIYGRTSANTGYMQVKLFEGARTEEQLGGTDYKNIYYRDTYYKGDEDTLYNVPLYSESDLHHGTYTILVTIAKKGTPTTGNKNGAGSAFYLDGIRIADPLDVNANNELVGKALTAYAADGELNNEVVTLRQKIISNHEQGINLWDRFVSLTDLGPIRTVEDFIEGGPKEEVYLAPGHSLSFALYSWHRDGYVLNLGMKSPNGNGKVQIGNDTYTLTNTVEYYYDITDNYDSLQNVPDKYRQKTTVDGHLIYTDGAEEAYQSDDGYFYYVEGGAKVSEEADLTPVYDLTQPIQVAYFTITVPTDAPSGSIVSITNLKLTGEYTFNLAEEEERDINVEGYEN